MGAGERVPEIRRRLLNFTTERWDSLAHHREDGEEFYSHAAGDILWLLDEVERLRAVEAAARAVIRRSFADLERMGPYAARLYASLEGLSGALDGTRTSV
jgi:hypothetical protein